MTKIIIKTPNTRLSERSYVSQIIFGEWLGIEFELMPEERSDICIALHGVEKKIKLPDILFGVDEGGWLHESSLPQEDLKVLDTSDLSVEIPLVDSFIPIIYGEVAEKINPNDDIIYLPIDIFGSVFFMLTRYEEVVIGVRDKFDRFPATASLAYKNNFLYRPICDEYIELLWGVIKKCKPSAERKVNEGKVNPTCDVDEPYERWVSNPQMLLKGIMGALLKRRSFSYAKKRVLNFIQTKKGNYRLDPNWVFDWYMSQCEANGLIARFFFIPRRGKTKYDAYYGLMESRILKLMTDINLRGHEVGMHGSFWSYKNSQLISEDVLGLNKALMSVDIGPLRGSRQHFLRWSAKDTPTYLDAAGIEYDSTSFADAPGFRFGTSKKFSMWGWHEGRPLKIKQMPLVVMEGSVISYLKLGHSRKSLNMMLQLKSRALKFGGDFTFLWHNSHFHSPEDQYFFKALVENGVRK